LLHGQTGNANSESLAGISDPLMKREIASFTITGTSFHKSDSLSNQGLAAIPVSHCSDKEVHFSWSTFPGSVNTFIHLYFKGEIPDKSLDSIFVVTHSHYWVKLPAKVLQGFNQSNSCHFTGNGKNSKFFSPFYKAFYSGDKKRLSIYMLGGSNVSEYEVTWVIVDDKYYTRVLDNIP
jgi:hypothetical protein